MPKPASMGADTMVSDTMWSGMAGICRAVVSVFWVVRSMRIAVDDIFETPLDSGIGEDVTGMNCRRRYESPCRAEICVRSDS